MAESSRIEELERRVRLDPASIAFAALAEEYRRDGQFEEAIATCMAGLRRHPAYLSAHVTLGRALAAAGRQAAAIAELEYVLGLAPENLAAVRALAEIHQAGNAQQDASAGTALPAPALHVTSPHHMVSDAPALGGLEQFLDAIARARTERSAVR
jgi:tetratricopeptide (TPR) repeat protein